MNLCKVNKKKYKTAGSNAYIYKCNNKIIKSIPFKSNKELDIIKILHKNLKNTNIKILFVKISKVQRCNKYNYYLMNKYDFDIDKNFLTNISNINKINILKQILFALYYLNNIIKIYHNDLYYINDVRNIMCIPNNKTISLQYKQMKIIPKDYICKIIDFGWDSTVG